MIIIAGGILYILLGLLVIRIINYIVENVYNGKQMDFDEFASSMFILICWPILLLIGPITILMIFLHEHPIKIDISRFAKLLNKIIRVKEKENDEIK